MKASYGRNVDGIRVRVDEEDREVLSTTSTAAYRLGAVAAAHDGDSDFAEAMFDVQRFANELMKYTNVEMERGLHTSVSVIAAAAAATGHGGSGLGEELVEEAHEAWSGVLEEVATETDRAALNAATNPARDIPEDPWAGEPVDTE